MKTAGEAIVIVTGPSTCAPNTRLFSVVLFPCLSNTNEEIALSADPDQGCSWLINCLLVGRERYRSGLGETSVGAACAREGRLLKLERDLTGRCGLAREGEVQPDIAISGDVRIKPHSAEVDTAVDVGEVEHGRHGSMDYAELRVAAVLLDRVPGRSPQGPGKKVVPGRHPEPTPSML